MISSTTKTILKSISNLLNSDSENNNVIRLDKDSIVNIEEGQNVLIVCDLDYAYKVN
jgi:hypothetical protein